MVCVLESSKAGLVYLFVSFFYFLLSYLNFSPGFSNQGLIYIILGFNTFMVKQEGLGNGRVIRIAGGGCIKTQLIFFFFFFFFLRIDGWVEFTTGFLNFPRLLLEI
jgi:hypothetical protein